jgi:hypothetical protein
MLESELFVDEIFAAWKQYKAAGQRYLRANSIILKRKHNTETDEEKQEEEESKKKLDEIQAKLVELRAEYDLKKASMEVNNNEQDEQLQQQEERQQPAKRLKPSKSGNSNLLHRYNQF